MSPARKRKAVELAYPGLTWAAKVKNMSDAQVHNLYMRLLNSGKLKGLVF